MYRSGSTTGAGVEIVQGPLTHVRRRGNRRATWKVYWAAFSRFFFSRGVSSYVVIGGDGPAEVQAHHDVLMTMDEEASWKKGRGNWARRG